MRFLFLFLVLSAYAVAEGVPSPVADAVEARKTDGMVWNKWETDNFVVLSIDFGFGDRLRSSVESDRVSACGSWGVATDRLPVKCKLVCVPDAKTLGELFSIDSPRCEIRRDESLKPKEIAIWLDQSRSSSLPGLLISVSLHSAPLYLQRGSNILASPDSAGEISSLADPSFQSIFSVTSSSLSSLDRKERENFDRESAVLCLLARREFGSGAFSCLSRGARPEVALGFGDEKSFLETVRRYFANLKEDLQSGRTPRSYLEP